MMALSLVLYTIVVSRMESNIFKKLEKALDFVGNIIDSY